MKRRKERVIEVARALVKIIEPRKCKYCGSYHTVRYGRSRQIQRLRCLECGHTFLDTEALPGMKTPQEQVASALDTYYEGMSLNAIRRHLQQMYNNYPSDSTVYEWIVRFTNKAIRETRGYKPEVGDVWVADETVLKIGGQNVWFWDLIDAKTRYLLASHLSIVRTIKDAEELVEKAAKRAGKTPKVIITDKLAAYIDGIELAFGTETKHIRAKKLTSSPGTQLIERFHGSLKARTKVMRGLKSLETARRLMEGWLAHYNFFRPHEALGGHTPAEKAGIKCPYTNWFDIVKTSPVEVIPEIRRSLYKVPQYKCREIGRPRRRRKLKGDIYVSRNGNLMSRHPFPGGKPRKGRIV
jgi:putative transposase